MPFISNTTVDQDRPMDTTRRSGVSKIVKQSIPGFVLDEYPLLVEFLEAYYEWLDQKGNPFEFLQNGNRYFDVDTTTDEFLKYFKSSFLDGFPQRIATIEGKEKDERTLIKNIRELYKIKGSEKSIQLFFRLIADSDSIIEYPREMMFSLSSANYRNYHKIHVLRDSTAVSNGFDPTEVEGLVLNQYEGVTELIGSATMLQAYEIESGGKQYFVFLVANPVGEFLQSDFMPLLLTQNGVVHEFYPATAVSGLQILNGGKDYSAGEFFTIGNTAEQCIRGFISQTDYEGKISKVRLFDTPVNYTGTNTVSIQSPIGTGAAFALQTTVLSEAIQEYENNKNLLSSVSRIQDSFEYQQFSYVIKSKRSLEEYIDAIKRVVHPSGFVIFNSLYNNVYSIRPSQYGTRAMAYENTSIGSYAGYNFTSRTGSGDTGGWNVYRAGNPDPAGNDYKWGAVFNRWDSYSGVPFNPSESTNGEHEPDTRYFWRGDTSPKLGATFAKILVDEGTNPTSLSVLPNNEQTQYSGITEWIAMPHPSIRQMTEIPNGTEFKDIRIIDILAMPVPIFS